MKRHVALPLLLTLLCLTLAVVPAMANANSGPPPIFQTGHGSGMSGDNISMTDGSDSDGAHPVAGLVRDAAGNLYGTIEQGGDLTCSLESGCGTVLKIETTGKEKLLYSFTGGADGARPVAGPCSKKAFWSVAGKTVCSFVSVLEPSRTPNF
jgi:hypothetical protein